MAQRDILHFWLGGIAGNFNAGDPASLAVLDALIKLEDALIASGEFDSDFAYIAARAR